jgi:hypothetical protein
MQARANSSDDDRATPDKLAVCGIEDGSLSTHTPAVIGGLVRDRVHVKS